MLKFVSTPLFLVLAAISYKDTVYLCVMPGSFSFLSSMWFMYLIMAVVHAESWANWLRRQLVHQN